MTTKPVAIPTPISPNVWIAIAVAMEAAVMLTIVLPMRMVIRRCSGILSGPQQP